MSSIFPSDIICIIHVNLQVLGIRMMYNIITKKLPITLGGRFIVLSSFHLETLHYIATLQTTRTHITYYMLIRDVSVRKFLFYSWCCCAFTWMRCAFTVWPWMERVDYRVCDELLTLFRSFSSVRSAISAEGRAGTATQYDHSIVLDPK